MCLTTKKLKFIAPPVRTYTALKNNAENTIQDPTNNQTISFRMFYSIFQKNNYKKPRKTGCWDIHSYLIFSSLLHERIQWR